MTSIQSYAFKVDIGTGYPTIHANPDGFLITPPFEKTSAQPVKFNQLRKLDQASLRQILAGCIKAGSSLRKTSSATLSGLKGYIFSLCASYHSTHAARTNFLRARDGFLAMGDQHSAEFMQQKWREEHWHDLLALKDIRSIGLPAQQLVNEVYPPAARAICALFDKLANENEPYGVYGYCYVLERMSLFTSQSTIDKTQALSPTGSDITHCMRVHSSVGADVQHVADLLENMLILDDEALLQICRAVHLTSQTVYQSFDNSEEIIKMEDFLRKHAQIEFS